MSCSFISSIPLVHRSHHHHNQSLKQVTSTFVRNRHHRLFTSTTPQTKNSSSTTTTTTHSMSTLTPPKPIASPATTPVIGKTPIYAQCMLRINDPLKSCRFYEDTLGMKQLTRFDFPAFKFSLWFYAYTDATPPSQDEVSQTERSNWLWSRSEPVVELTWNWIGETYEESMDKLKQHTNEMHEEVYLSGNDEKYPKGFGYIQISIDNIEQMKTLLDTNNNNYEQVEVEDDEQNEIIIKDPDGYHIKLIQRNKRTTHNNMSNNIKSIKDLDPVFNSVMLRVKDITKAIPFFQSLGFHVISSVDNKHAQTSTYYLCLLSDVRSDQSIEDLRCCSVTLVQHWGTEREDVEQMYTNGNVKPYRGFGHLGIIIDDIYDAMNRLEVDGGYRVVRKPSPFADVGEIAFIAEPSTDYFVEIIKRYGEAPDVLYEQPIVIV